MKHDVIIVGAGLAGLALALELEKKGLDCVILEAQDRVGGRIQSDVVDGFILDRGFQVLLPHYPTINDFFDFKALDLCAFDRAAILDDGQQQRRLGLPFFSDLSWAEHVRNGLRFFSDFQRLFFDFFRFSIVNPESFALRFSEKTLSEFFEARFSATFSRSFLTPFFKGILSDPHLQSSSRLYYFYMLCFLLGGAAIPKEGMRVLPENLAYRLKKTTILLNENVCAVKGACLHTDSGKRFEAKKIVFTSAHELLTPFVSLPAQFSSLATFYFSHPGLKQKYRSLILQNHSEALVNHVAVLSDISPSYAAEGTLISATVLGEIHDSESYLPRVESELTRLFDLNVGELRFLRAYPIKKVLPYPAQFSGHSLRLSHDIYDIAGDWSYQGSIHGALRSAQCCAERLLSFFNNGKD